MKHLLYLSLLILPSLVFACADLSGDYVANTGEEMKVVQMGCEKLSLIYTDRTEEFGLDHVKRLVYQDEQVSSYASAGFVPYSPIIRMTWENHSKDITQKHFRRLALFQKSVLLDQIGKYRSDGYFIPDHQITFHKKN